MECAGDCLATHWAVSMIDMLATTVRAMKRFFNGGRQSRFESRRPAEVSLPAETTAVLDSLKARYSIDVTLPAEPFSIWLEHRQYLAGIEGQAATSE
jgi:hypothetical protein